MDELWEIYTDSEGKVVVYTDSGYKGNSAILFNGKHDIDGLMAAGIPNDSISSVKVPDGYEVIAYRDICFSGDSVVYRSDMTYV